MTVYDLIEKHEGRKLKPYKCPAGKNTIGVGWNMDDNQLPPDIEAHLKETGRITDTMADRLLETSVAHSIHDCHVIFPEFDSFSENRRMALTDFVFQLGFRKARSFTNAITAINAGNWSLAATHMSRSIWYEQVPKRAEEIIGMIERG